MIDSQTFRSRLVELMQRSRRAMRAYAGMNSSSGSPAPSTVIHTGFASNSSSNKPSLEYSELQAEEWRSVNADLLKHLGAALDQPNPRMLLPQVVSLLDRLANEDSLINQDINAQRNELLHAFNAGDYIKSAICSRNLVILKARQQATAAAHSELEQVVGKARASNLTNSSQKSAQYSYSDNKELFAAETPASGGFVPDSVRTTIELDSIVSTDAISSALKPKPLKSINFQEEDNTLTRQAQTDRQLDQQLDPQGATQGRAKVIPLRRAFR